MEFDGLLVDLDHVPKKWFRSLIPAEIDQKLYEMHVLYDRDWMLTDTKLLISKSYASPERVDIRSETHVVDCDVYLSRATSALSRNDYQSGFLFAQVALESILKVLVEICLIPFSNSHMLEAYETSSTKLHMTDVFREYSEISLLDDVDEIEARNGLKLFKSIWDEANATMQRSLQTFESLHSNVRSKLHYFLNPVFLQGMVERTNELIDFGRIVEAKHYVKGILLDILEEYVWFKSAIKGFKPNYATLIRSLEKLEEKNPRNCRNIMKAFDLEDISKATASDAIGKARKEILKVREKRKVLIKNHLTRT
jgi:hypothetical protein